MTNIVNNADELKYFKRGEKCKMVVPSNIQAMMTGAQYIYHKDNKKVCIVYTDGTMEEALYSGKIPLSELPYMEAVSIIQSMREK